MRMISGCKLGTSGQRYQSAGEYLMETVKKAQPKTYKTFAELLEKESKKLEALVKCTDYKQMSFKDLEAS